MYMKSKLTNICLLFFCVFFVSLYGSCVIHIVCLFIVQQDCRLIHVCPSRKTCLHGPQAGRGDFLNTIHTRVLFTFLPSKQISHFCLKTRVLFTFLPLEQIIPVIIKLCGLPLLEPCPRRARICLGASGLIYRGLHVLFTLMQKWLRTDLIIIDRQPHTSLLDVLKYNVYLNSTGMEIMKRKRGWNTGLAFLWSTRHDPAPI